MKHKGDVDTNCWNGPQHPKKEIGRNGDQRKSRNYSDHTTCKIR